MMYSTVIYGRSDINNAIERKIWFPVIGRDSKTYREILNYLSSRCDPDTWTIILTHELIGENEAKSSPVIRKRYRPYHIQTKVSRETSDQYTVTTITDTYHCTYEAIDLLKLYENFFSIEDEIDVAFYEGETCLLWTINHEQKLNLNPVFFQNLTSVIKSEKHLDEHYFSDYAYCTKNILPYGLNVSDRKTLAETLMKIFPYCDTFSLVQRKGTRKKIDESLDPWKVSDEFDPVQWPTAAYQKNIREVFTYSCCNESLEALMDLPDLCEGEMIFSRKKLCVAYTLPAEKKIVLDVFYLFWEHRLILDPNPPWEN